MMVDLSPEQQAVIDSPLVPLSVIACAGSGKTTTAVRRLLAIRHKLGPSRGYVALLSFSNVAVQTFRADYQNVLHGFRETDGSARVLIETVDSFLATNILRPHAHRTMRSSRAPFLIDGSEPFLRNDKFKFSASPETRNAYPVTADQVGVSLVDGKPTFFCSSKWGNAYIPINNGQHATEQLGIVGAYTHDLGRYWAHRTLVEQPAVLRALAHRYPHLLIDEAQDIGTIHRAILELLAKSGVQVSLIGDPDQAIYEFAGADGKFLSGYEKGSCARSYTLNTNYRSVPTIISTANAIAKRTATADRAARHNQHGAFFVQYDETDRLKLVRAFQKTVTAAGLDLSRSAVVCRGRNLVHELRGTDSDYGQGVVRGFVTATLLRDNQLNYLEAFKVTAGCIVALLSNGPDRLYYRLLNASQYPEARALRRMIWTFVRDSDSGLPLASLIADTEWHPLLVQRVGTFLDLLQTTFGYQPVSHLGNKLAKKQLPNIPLAVPGGEKGLEQRRIRIDTVHQVKGESLDAVLYIATKANVRALIDGVESEDGRIGYVALTRARDLFWLGIPNSSAIEIKEHLLSLGFRE